jgi:pimeloyl-ACP methyl ester carboxylesterase
MNKPPRSDLAGAARLAVEAVSGVTALVEAVHMNVLERAIGTPAVAPVRAVTRMVYRAIGMVTALAGRGLDDALARAAPLLSGPDWKGRGPVLAALNGVVGDHLEASRNPLALGMTLSPAAASGRRIALLIHGLCMSGAQWRRQGADHGAMLAEARGYVPLYLDYNSGRHVSDNGRELAAVLRQLAARAEVEEIVVVAHSMGGLVLRSALLQDPAPIGKLSRVVFLGTPHLGAQLERIGNWVNNIADLNAYSAPFSKLAKLRSAGITDLRHGTIDPDGRAPDRFAHSSAGVPAPLPAGIAFHAVAGVLDKIDSDGLVSRDSALARGTLAFAATATLPRTGHMELLSSPEVGSLLRQWL